MDEGAGMAIQVECVCMQMCVGERIRGVGVYTHPVTTQPLPQRKVSETWPCSIVGLVINSGAVREGCRMIN